MGARRAVLIGWCTTAAVWLSGCKNDTSVGACTVSALAFPSAPGNTTGGATLPALRVEAHDASAAIASCFHGNVTVSLAANPAGVTLSGTTTVAAVGGVATFSDLRIDKVGSYALTVVAQGVGAATSASFSVTAGAATKLSFVVQPSTALLAAGITPAVAVAATDPGGNTDPSFAANVTVAIGTDPSNGALSGTATVAAVAGVATFPGLSIDKTGTGYTLTAGAAGVASATSGAFDIVTTLLAFTMQPGTTVAAAGITPAITVAATIPGGGTDPAFTGSVTIAIGANPASGSLTGTKTVNAVAGVATFSDLHIDKAGTGYTLAATSPGASGATSGTFSVIAGAAAQLTFTVQPSATAAGAGITPAVAVTASDLAGNLATSYSGAVTVAIGSNPGSGTLSGTATHSAVAGVATFTGLSINNAGTGYTLVASANGVTSATSGSFDVTTVQSGPLPSFGHVVIVVEENTSFSEVSDTTMPYLHSLMAQYGLATQYYANTHPSIGNYFEMTAGQIITNSDSYQLTVPADNIVRHLLAAGKTWKDYAEDLPSVGYTGPSTGNYARKHNPLSFFSDVVNDSVQVKRLVPFTQFALDLGGDTLPNYAFIVPNLCNDAHDCALSIADTWLQTNIAPLLNNASFKRDGLLIVTFDEASGDDTNGGGRVVWTVISPKAKTAYVSTTLYQHQSTLRLSAEALGLTSFPGDAATASNMAEFFHP